MDDLLYFGHAGYSEYWAARESVSSLPAAQVQDASDEVHGWRFSVQCSLSEEEWYAWLTSQGLSGQSLAWRLDDLTGQMDAMASEEDTSRRA